MQANLQLQENTIVLVPSSETPINPAIVNEESLRYGGTIPMEWELARAPIYTPQVTQLIFQDSITITAQSNRILFTEIMGDKPMSHSQIAPLVRRFVNSLPNLRYDAIGFNPLGHALIGEQAEAVSQYLNQTLLASGPWQEVGQAPVRSRISFTYTLERGQLNLTVSEAGMRNEDETITPIAVFAGNFNYTITGNNQPEWRESVMQSLEHWHADLEVFQAIVNEKFLASVQQSAQPVLLAGLAS